MRGEPDSAFHDQNISSSCKNLDVFQEMLISLSNFQKSEIEITEMVQSKLYCMQRSGEMVIWVLKRNTLHRCRSRVSKEGHMGKKEEHKKVW